VDLGQGKKGEGRSGESSAVGGGRERRPQTRHISSCNHNEQVGHRPPSKKVTRRGVEEIMNWDLRASRRSLVKMGKEKTVGVGRCEHCCIGKEGSPSASRGGEKEKLER